VADLVVLAVASAFWPALLAVVIVSLRAPHPARLMASFLAGGLLTTVTVGLAIIHALRSSPATSSSRNSFGPGVAIVGGALALLAAYVLASKKPAAQQEQQTPKPPGRVERMLDRGVPLAFVAGILLDIIPGVLPFVALQRIAEMDLTVAETFAITLGFYVIMFAFVEIPLVAYLVAPSRTALATARFNAWLDRNARRLAVWALTVAGIYLLASGIVELVL
jgi:hypothetical protein